MKHFFIIFLLIFLSSCSAIDFNNLAPGYSEAYRSVYSYFSDDKNNSQITEELIQNIPYASAIISIGRGKDALMILESKNKLSEYTWVSQDGIYLVFKNGRIVKTSGLQNNLIESIAPVINYSELLEKKSISYLQYLSYDDPELYNLKVETTLTFKGTQEVILFDKTEKLFLVEEKIKNKYLGWEKINKYWLDDELKMKKGTQFISPILPEFFFEITKKPAI